MEVEDQEEVVICVKEKWENYKQFSMVRFQGIRRKVGVLKEIGVERQVSFRLWKEFYSEILNFVMERI